MDLFSLIEDKAVPLPNDSWRPEPPPSLDGITDICLNFETTGLRWWENDRPLAISLYAGDRAYYLPWGHRGSGNLDEATVKRWAERELRGKRITNINTRFEVHMSREWGVDLEAQGNEVSDVGHYAALLDDHRLHMNLDSLIQDFLHETPMGRLDESKMKDYPAGLAAPRAMYNVETVHRLKDVMWPMLTAQDLHRVRALEDKVIFVVAEMEKNGAPIDVELLDRWIKESQERLNKILMQVGVEAGFQVNPDSPKDMLKLFQRFNLPVVQTKGGRPSFTDEVLKRIQHPTIQKLRMAGKIMSLRSKYLVSTKAALDSHGILRYSLHQLRAAKDEYSDAGEAGTVTGRFSSAAPVPGVGCNIQQRMKAARQRVSFGYDEDDESHDDEIFLIRRLHVARNGKVLSSDMDQAQYRIFASYANNPRVIEAYQKNPHLSFHKLMHAMLSDYAKLTYRQQKDTNFAYLFGAGVTKMAMMLGHITQAEYDKIRNSRDYNNPKLKATKEVRRIYEREVPEMKFLLEQSAFLGKPRCDDRCKLDDFFHRKMKHQGFVTTALGRRMRFPDGQRLHKAFNGIDQGTEADYMKLKLVELHERRHETQLTLRITNHDEVVGDIPDAEHARIVNDLLNQQSLPELRVPLTWSTGIGPNWADLEDV